MIGSREDVQVVKGYPQGKMSKHIVDLEPGDELEFKGPIGKVALIVACLHIRQLLMQNLLRPPIWQMPIKRAILSPAEEGVSICLPAAFKKVTQDFLEVCFCAASLLTQHEEENWNGAFPTLVSSYWCDII